MSYLFLSHMFNPTSLVIPRFTIPYFERLSLTNGQLLHGADAKVHVQRTQLTTRHLVGDVSRSVSLTERIDVIGAEPRTSMNGTAVEIYEADPVWPFDEVPFGNVAVGKARFVQSAFMVKNNLPILERKSPVLKLKLVSAILQNEARLSGIPVKTIASRHNATLETLERFIATSLVRHVL